MKSELTIKPLSMRLWEMLQVHWRTVSQTVTVFLNRPILVTVVCLFINYLHVYLFSFLKTWS